MMRIEACRQAMLGDWATLRHALWPDETVEEHFREAEALLREPERVVTFLARVPQGPAIGFAEATLRRDYVNGCTSTPVAFLEGIYVEPAHRTQGVARMLCRAVQDWAVALGCTELASDVDIHNTVSQMMHAALGFDETERVVYFRKRIR